MLKQLLNSKILDDKTVYQYYNLYRDSNNIDKLKKYLIIIKYI